MNDLIPIEKKNGMATVSSLEVAKDFEKRHDHVIRDLETLMARMSQSPQNGGDSQSAQNSADSHDPKNYFIPGSYHDSKNRKQPMYFLTRDGFQLLAMGFTGDCALQWKLKYIEAFDKMESVIRKAIQEKPPSALTALEQTLEVLKSFDARMTAIEAKTDRLAEAVKPDWLSAAKFRVEALTGKDLRYSGLLLAGVYKEIEESCNVMLNSRLMRYKKKERKRGVPARELHDLSKLYIISLDERLKAAFENIISRME